MRLRRELHRRRAALTGETVGEMDDAARRAADPSTAGHGDSPLLSLLPHILRLLRREPALGVTLAYLLVAMAGIAYDYHFYRQFDIPVLSLMQIGDFLVAGIQQPIAPLLVLSTLPLCWLMDRWNMRVFRRQLVARDRLHASETLSRWQRLRLRYLDWHVGQVRLGLQLRTSYALVIVLYGWLFVGLYAEHRAAVIKRGEAPEMTVWLNGDATPLAPPQAASWTYLGGIGNYVFVHDRTAARAQILPTNAVARLEPQPRARRRGVVEPSPVAPSN